MQDKLRRFKAEIFQALAHPTRIAIVELLRDAGEVPVTSIYERLELVQANASQHLAVLRSKHIVVARKDGTKNFISCAINLGALDPDAPLAASRGIAGPSGRHANERAATEKDRIGGTKIMTTSYGQWLRSHHAVTGRGGRVFSFLVSLSIVAVLAVDFLAAAGEPEERRSQPGG